MTTQFVATCFAVLAMALCPANRVDAQVKRLDRLMVQTMSKFDLPGGQLAVVKDGRLVHSRGYGYADLERRKRVRTNSLFRLGSVSKTITQIAILTLVDQGKLRLEDRAFRLLESLKPPAGSAPDSRLADITVMHLLKHQGGWDGSVEPMFLPWSRKAAEVLGVPEPATCETIIRYMMSRPLDYAPGARIIYSNFGYCVLGRIIERASGMPYEEYVQRAVLTPAGIHDMRIGGTRLQERAPREVRYYHQTKQTELSYLTASVYPKEGEVPWAYGGYYLRATDSHGGWIGSAEDIVRIASSIDGQRGKALLSPASVNVMMNLPRKESEQEPVGSRFHVSHAGALQGSGSALLDRRREGISIGFTFNSLPVNYMEFFEYMMGEIDRALPEILEKDWPTGDRFRR
ncbi:MAG TPA: serine hydrolase domain-containing protein [Bryobacteraceae bacterium]|nr:serine hydrolase domain-containing protein [Bryobacteraceae bacterium]